MKAPIRIVPPLAALAAFALAPVARVAAQASAAGLTMTVDASDRWMHGSTRPELTLRRDYSDEIRIDSVRGARAERTVVANFAGSSGDRRIAGRVVHDAAGRPLRIWAARPPHGDDAWMRLDSVSLLNLSLIPEGAEGTLRLPAARLWELVPTWAPGTAPRAGARWTDSLDYATELGGYRQALRGRRVSTIVKDTAVAGRRLWVVRDSARVRYAERWLRFERTLDTIVVVERTAKGVIVGRHLYDPALRLFRARDDSTALAGEAVLRYPDGRAFRTPARYDRVRRWVLRDSAGLAFRDSVRADSEIVERGVVRDEAGDSVSLARLRDSLIAVVRGARDPAERARAFAEVRGMEVDGDSARHAMRTLALQAGDTAWAMLDILGDVYTTYDRRPDMGDMERLIRVMDDPGTAFSLGIDLDPFYEDLRQGLLTHPPATDPPSTWSCTRAACELLVSQRTRAHEPRLRKLALVAALALDPPRWADSVLDAARTDSSFFHDAAQLVRGAAALGRSDSQAPLPPPGAEWRRWLAWMHGDGQVAFGDRHALAIRFARALTGRYVAAEMRARLAAATEDSARLVYSAILLGLGERIHGPLELVAALRSPSAAERAAALREVPAIFSAAVPADSATAAALIGRLLAVELEEAEMWPTLPGDSVSARLLRGWAAGSRPVYLVGDSIPAAVRASWAARAQVLGEAEWAAHPRPDSALVVHVTRPMRAGPFARLYVTFTEFFPLHRGGATVAGVGGATVTLVELDGRWVLLLADTWIS